MEILKQFVETLDANGVCFEYIEQEFSGTSTEKIKAVIFDGPQMQRLVSDRNVDKTMNETSPMHGNDKCQ